LRRPKRSLLPVLEDDRRAERELEGLRLALPLGLEQLKASEHAHREAEIEFRRARVHHLARQRVEAGAAIDQAFSDFAEAWSDYESLGHELLDLASQEPGSNALFLAETISGVARLAASLPAAPFLAIREKYNFLPISTHKSLAAAEAQYWRLPALDEAA